MEEKSLHPQNIETDSALLLNQSLLGTIAGISQIEQEWENSAELPVKLRPEWISDELPCVYCNGVQYYDLSKAEYLANHEIAKIVSLVKSLLARGIEVHFVNTSSKIKKKIKSLELEHIFNCE